MEQNGKIDSLIKNIILLQGKTDQWQKALGTEQWKSKNALNEAERSLGNTARNIEKLTAQKVNEAVGGPLKTFGSDVEKLCLKFAAVTERAEAQQRAAEKRLKIFQWTALSALALSALISIGSALWVLSYAKQEIARSEWVGDINKAVDKGKLIRCADGQGICANIRGRLVRLDK